MKTPTPQPDPSSQRKAPNTWRKSGFEFLSIFIAVISAFALNNWNDNRKDALSESKILTEISNGLEKDLEDIRLNKNGHTNGIAACEYFRKILVGENEDTDSTLFYYHYLTRDFISIQNVAGYETLKSKGLELIDNDSLRLAIISLYEYDYNTLRKLEEEYYEMQFQANYFTEINEILAPHFSFDSLGAISGLQLPLELKRGTQNKALLYIWKIQSNRLFILQYYAQIERSITEVREMIENEINE